MTTQRDISSWNPHSAIQSAQRGGVLQTRVQERPDGYEVFGRLLEFQPRMVEGPLPSAPSNESTSIDSSWIKGSTTAPLTVALDETTHVTLPVPSEVLLQSMIRSKRLLELADDWDGMGSIPPTYDAWADTMTLLAETALAFAEESHEVMPQPSITAGGDGDIDIVFRHGDRLVSINVAAEEEGRPVLAGRSGKGGSGRVDAILDADPNGESWFVHWLMKG